MTAWLSAWFWAFLLTELVEAPLYVALLRCSWGRALGASALSHPLVWFGFFHPLTPGGYWPRVIAAELFAVALEAAYFRYLLGPPLRRAAVASLVANAASVAVGLLSRRLLDWP